MVYDASIPGKVADHVYDAIRRMVFRGDLRPGQKVSQRRLARQLGCSPLPVLEAIRRLESDGLLVSAPRCIAKVRELSLVELEGLYLVREGLEAVAARLAAAHINDQQLAQLRELSGRFEDALGRQDRAVTSLADVELHKLIAQISQCPLLGEELSRLTLIERTAGQAEFAHAPVMSPYSSHRALIQALADHDADAAEYFMKKHIQAGYNDLVRTAKQPT